MRRADIQHVIRFLQFDPEYVRDSGAGRNPSDRHQGEGPILGTRTGAAFAVDAEFRDQELVESLFDRFYSFIHIARCDGPDPAE